MGRVTMFIGLVWLLVCLAGSVMAKSNAVVATRLTSAITATSTTIPVRSTTGFPSTGVIWIDGEKIAYASMTSTAFQGTLLSPLVRGAEGTTAATHSTGAVVRTREAYLINASIDYDLARISDSAGFMLFITVPMAVFDILKNFFTLPLGFLGTDLQILTYIWGLLLLGFVVALAITMLGGRRV